MIPRAVVTNPLSMIAIFAGLVEVGGTAVLPFLDPCVQSTYVWFLMLFPALLVLLFFCVLAFRHEHLYAPSDYQNDDSFHRYAGRHISGVNTAIIESINHVGQLVAGDNPRHDEITEATTAQSESNVGKAASHDSRAASSRAPSENSVPDKDSSKDSPFSESDVIDAVARELANRFKGEFYTDIKDRITSTRFDILGETSNGTVLAEVIRSSGPLPNIRISQALNKFKNHARSLSESDWAKMRQVLVLVVPSQAEASNALIKALKIVTSYDGRAPQVMAIPFDELPLVSFKKPG